MRYSSKCYPNQHLPKHSLRSGTSTVSCRWIYNKIIQNQLVFILMVTIQLTPRHQLIVEHYTVNTMLFHGYPTYSRSFYNRIYVTSWVRTFRINDGSYYSYRRVNVYSLLYKLHRYNVIICLPQHSRMRYIHIIPLKHENDDFRHLIPTFMCKNYDLLRSSHSVVYSLVVRKSFFANPEKIGYKGLNSVLYSRGVVWGAAGLHIIMLLGRSVRTNNWSRLSA